MKRLLTVVGARPQFIKAAAVSRALRQKFSTQMTEALIHTGQHFDDNMSAVFFEELQVTPPRYHLGVSGGSHAAMTARMLESLEPVMLDEKPDWVLIYGDTNSTLAAALAAAKLHLPIAHVEAGLRSFNTRMPEEVNRIVADHLSTQLFCPTEAAMSNLEREGLAARALNVGDVMFDVALHVRERARTRSEILSRLGLTERAFILATCHRAENTDDPARLGQIVRALAALAEQLPVVLPLHPRTRAQLVASGLDRHAGAVRLIDPVAFLDMVALEQSARAIVTDSGGVQKEAYFYRVPCVTMRDETEWVETVALGWNTLAGASTEAITEAAQRAIAQASPTQTESPYGAGDAAERILSALLGA
jgi:UDP-GlcNAc3NAcA epimerase